MTAFAVIGAMAAALCVGYHFGRRADSTSPTWKKRTSRIALGRLAMSLLVLMAARRIRQSLQAGRAFPGTVGARGLRLVVPRELLRVGVARMRSY